jgi:L-alanine-DL-glutamate epimerase-like enolase superfamily enzyme
LLLRIMTDDGRDGVAEVTVKPKWNGVSLRSIAAILEDVLLPELAAIDVGDPLAVALLLAGFPECTAAKTLIDNACWDLRACAANRPLWQTWGGRGTVPVSWTVTRHAPARMADEAAEMTARHGFGVLKLKGGQGIGVDVEAVRRVRAAVGSSVRLYVDANWAYTAAQTEAYASALADEGVFAIEDPCPLHPDGAFTELQARCRLPLLVDGPCASRRDARLFLDRGARALSAKPSRVGLTECQGVVAIASERGARAVTGLFGESALGSLAGLALAASLPPSELDLPAELSFHLMFAEQVLHAPLAVASGAIQLPAVASLAALVDWDRVARLAP